jgi:hypothetical protein
MATKTEPKDEPEAKAKAKSVFSETGTYADGEHKGLRWGDLSYDGVTYRVRQTTVDEGDENYDAAYNEKTQRFNGRLNSRLNLAAAIVSPPTSIDDMGKWSGHKLVTLLRGWDELNLLKEADTEGNG